VFIAFSVTTLVIFNDICSLVTAHFKVQNVQFEIRSAMFCHFKSILLLEMTVLELNSAFNVVGLL